MRSALTLLDPENRASGANYGKVLPRRAEQALRLDLDRDLGRLRIGGSLFAEGRRYDDLANTREMGGYAILNLRGEYTLAKAWRLQARIENLLDKQYETASFYNQPGRSYFVTLRYNPEPSNPKEEATMLTLSNRNQIVVGLALVAMLTLTRGQHFATLHSLPGASWAVFFLAGVYLRPAWVLPAMLAFVWGLDFTPHLLSGASLAEIVRGGQAFCLTPAYFFLLPAYAALWFAGRWYAGRHRFAWRTLLPLTAAAIAGAAVCELFSSGGFYFFSGRFAEPILAEFAGRLVTYFPRYLQSLAFYVGIAAVVHALFGLARGVNTTHRDVRVSR